MKILLINYEYPPLGGGGGIASEKLAKGWASLGHEVIVLTTRAADLPKHEVQNGVKIFRVPVLSRRDPSSASMLSLFSFPMTAFLKGVLLCKKYHFDVINTHFAIPTGPVGLMLSKLFRAPNILTIIGADIYDPTRKYSPHKNKILGAVVKLMINTANAVVAISKNTKENAEKYFKPKKEIAVIPLAFEKPKIELRVKRQELRGEEVRLVSVGRLVERKGYKYLLEAMTKLPSSVHLRIISDGPQREELLELARRLGIGNRVKLLGFVSEEEKYQQLVDSDIYVLSSLHEGFGIVLQEAMEVGLPIVATNWGGQTDFLVDRENALLVPPANSEALVAAIKKLIDDSDLMSKMEKNNKEKVKQFYIPNVAKQYLELFGRTIPCSGGL